MKTEKLINNLVNDLSPSRPMIPARYFTSIYFATLVCLVGISYILLPTRENLDELINMSFFHSENLLWLFTGLASAYTSYKLIRPGSFKEKYIHLDKIIFGLLTISIIARLPIQEIWSHIMLETQLWRGWCGPIITIIGLIALIPLNKYLKRGLVTNKILFSLSLALAIGSIGTLAMQVICAHETSVHILMWHYPPLIILGTFIFYKFSKNNM